MRIRRFGLAFVLPTLVTACAHTAEKPATPIVPPPAQQDTQESSAAKPPPAAPQDTQEKVTAAPEATPESVHLKFAWPEKLVAKISVEGKKSRSSGADMFANFEMDLHVSRVSGKRTVELTGAFMESLGVKLPIIYMVNDDGSFGGLKDPEKFAASMLEEMDRKSPGTASANTPGMVDLLTKLAVASAESDWNATVGMWNDASLDLGDLYGSESEGPIPGSNAPVKYQSRFSIARRLPCNTTETLSNCVELTFHSEPDPKAIPAVIEGLSGQLMGNLQGKIEASAMPTVVSALIENDLTMVVEPDTLLPHQIKRVKSTRITVNDPDKGEVTMSNAQESTQRYTYLTRE